MTLWLLVIASIAPSVILSVLIRFAPVRMARLAFLPMRRAALLALPARVAEIVSPPAADSGTYRESAAREVALIGLPGAARVEHDHHVILFLPELRCILAYPAFAPGRLLRVDVAHDAGGWLLRARRFPADALLGPVWAVALLGFWVEGWHWPAWLLAALAAGQAYAVFKGRSAAAESFDVIVTELKARVALANGETPPPSKASIMGSRFTGPEEWTCACGKVNPRKRGMCARCWSQRPAG